jgi:CHAT domain-containing protein/tetratricopeptide (TPR) repeat protein
MHGVDASLEAFAPDGTLIERLIEPSIIEGKKSVWFVTRAEGTYRVEVHAAASRMTATYDLLLERHFPATADNEDFIRIDQGINHGLQLQETGTEAALRQAIPILTEVVDLAARNKRWPKDAHPGWSLGTSLMYLGEIYLSLGEYGDALDVLERVFKVDDWNDTGWTLKVIGDVYAAQGMKQQALEYYSRSLPEFEFTYYGRVRRGPAIARTAIGALYASLGDYDEALGHLERALGDWRHDGEIRGEATALIQIAEIYVQLGRSSDALAYYDKALQVHRSTSDHLREGRVLCAMGRAQITLNDYHGALALLDESILAAKKAGDRRGQADALTEVGRVLSLSGRNEEALERLSESLEVFRSLRASEGEAASLFVIATVERDSGKLVEARRDVEAAIERIELTRVGLSDQQLRSSYLATVRHYYDFYIDILMRLDRQTPGGGLDIEALSVSERARARSLLDSLSAALRGVSTADSALIEQKRGLLARIAVRQRIHKDLDDPATPTKVIEQSFAEFQRLRREYLEIEKQIRVADERYASLTNPSTLNAKEIQGLLDEGTLLLEYSLGDENSYLWAVSQSSVVSYHLPKRAEVEKKAREVYELLTSRNHDPNHETRAQFATRVARDDAAYGPVATELSRMILGPVASRLGKSRLVIVAEGALQFIPFGALPHPESRGQVYRPLIAEHEVITLPSASVIHVLRDRMANRKRATKSVAVLADPVFTADDARVRRKATRSAATTNRIASPQFKADLVRALEDVSETAMPRLLSTRWEAEQIIGTVGSRGFVALDFDASRETAMSETLHSYRVVHVASHAIIDDIHPELSGLVLSMVDREGRPRDGYLRLGDIYNLKLSADLVVLSACRTGLGKDVRGEGLIGLTRGFMYAGASRVVVSQWRVNDQATADLMARFYRHLSATRNSRQTSAGKALRLAQLEMLKDRRFRSPYFWAAFTLQGDWR